MALLNDNELFMPFPKYSDGNITLRGLKQREVQEFVDWLRDPELARYTFGLKLSAGDVYVQSVVDNYMVNVERILNTYAAICVDDKLIGRIFYNTRMVAGIRLIPLVEGIIVIRMGSPFGLDFSTASPV